MNTANICIMLAIIVYLVIIIAVGARYTSNNHSTGDFYLGGRKLGPLVTAMSAEASDMSSWLLMGLPGVAYATGICDAAWTAIGLAIGTYLNWLIVARRLRLYTQELGVFTVPGFFSRRYRDGSHILLAIAAIVIVVFFVPYTGSGFAACGKLFGTLFGIDYHVAMVVSAIVIVVYTTLGGFMAASVTDLIQSIVMTIALVVILVFATVMAGGPAAVMDNANSMMGYLSLTATHDPATGSAVPYGAITAVSMLAWGLGYFGMPHILVRFMAIENINKLKLSRRVASIWVVIAMGVAIPIGVIGNAMSKAGVIPVLTDPETIIINTAGLLSSFGILPALLAGIILAGILACTMSTADSQLLAASSAVSENLVKGVFKINISSTATMLVARLTLVIIGIIAIIIAWDPNSSVFSIVSFAWAGFGAAFAPLVLFSLFWRRTNRWGGLAGMISGGVMVFVWKYGIASLVPSLSKIYELLPAFLVSCLFIVVVSLLTTAPSREITDEFDRVNAMR